MLRKLREDKGALLKKMGDLYEAGKKADGMTEAQVKEYNEAKAAVEALDEQIRVAEDAEARASAVGVSIVSTGPSEKDKRDFSKLSLLRAARLAANGTKLDGIEGEMQQEAEKEARELGLSFGESGAGFSIPSIMLGVQGRNKRDLTVGTTTAGGHTVATDLGQMIPVLNPRPQVVELGATVMSDLVGNLDLPRHNTQAAASWAAENGTGSEADDALNKLSLSPKRLSRTTDVSSKLLIQSSIAVENWVRKSLSDSIAIALESAAINGSGSSNHPTGILGTSGIGDVAGGTNGLVPTWAHMVELESDIETANAMLENLAYYTTPGLKGKLKTVLKASGVAGYIWEGKEINGYKAVAGTLMPSTLTKGSASGICHAMIFGNWAELIIGQWGGVRVIVNPYTKSKEDLVEMTVHSFWDIGLMHPASFSAMQDALIS